ncbi:MAG: ATP-binding protein [Bacteroidota bacterium]|nr:ATP-binding protein [Bacteroidota bacterium]
MILQFSVENYKTFSKKATLNMISSNYYKEEDTNLISINNKYFNFCPLRSAIIYGANASGKSKLFEAISFLQKFIFNSSKESQAKETINIDIFKLNTANRKKPAIFEIIFLYKNIQYRYGFETTREKIESEWFFYKPKTKEIELFYRDNQTFEIHKTLFKKSKNLIDNDMVRDNVLFLSVAAQFNEILATNVMDWLKTLNVISGIKEREFELFTIKQLEKPKEKRKILEFLKRADLGIDDLLITNIDAESLPGNIPESLKKAIEKSKEKVKIIGDIKTVHRVYNEELLKTDETAIFSMDNEESSGTNKFFALSGPILDTLENGKILVIDELDAKLHPLLVLHIINLFNSPITNRKNAQLIFASHDTNLLKYGNFRRDQIWFTEKNRYGEVEFYSLSDIKIRKDEEYEKNYIDGKYGAIPFLGNFSELFKV